MQNPLWHGYKVQNSFELMKYTIENYRRYCLVFFCAVVNILRQMSCHKGELEEGKKVQVFRFNKKQKLI